MKLNLSTTIDTIVGSVFMAGDLATKLILDTESIAMLPNLEGDFFRILHRIYQEKK